jgi:pimeloyl-ACP methyl ester carboxylesterase
MRLTQIRRLTRRPRRVVRYSGVLAGVLAVAALCAAPSGARPSRVHVKKTSVKPTIVLVHGAWADASSWSSVIGELQHDSYTVVAPPNPLRGLAPDSAYLADFLKGIAGPVVLVGHSYGGAVITNAATGNAEVKALVYIDAFIPKQGQTVLELASAQPGSALGGSPQEVFDFVPFPGAPEGDADLYVKPSLFPSAFANGLPRETGAELAATQRPIAANALQEPSGPPAWASIPSWALIGTEDHVIPPAEQRVMAHEAHAKTTEVEAPHLSMLARPNAVAAVIESAADSIH